MEEYELWAELVGIWTRLEYRPDRDIPACPFAFYRAISPFRTEGRITFWESNWGNILNVLRNDGIRGYTNPTVSVQLRRANQSVAFSAVVTSPVPIPAFIDSVED